MSVAAAPRIAAERVQAPEQRGNSRPVQWWALVGGLILAFELYVIVRWVSGPYFRSVPSGPDSPPGWMKAALITWEAIGIPAAMLVVYWVLVRPWRRSGRPTTDGLLVVVCATLVFQDPLSSYFNNWFTYNAWLPNMGSWVNDIPGWVAFGAPGHQVPEPILWSPFMYCYAFFAITVIGSRLMRTLASRRPGISDLRLVATVAVAMLALDFVMEGLLMLPLGVFSYAGGHWALFPDSYHKFPAHEAVLSALWMTGFACVRYYRNDRGETLAERGIDSMKVSPLRQSALRFLALAGMLNVILFCLYNVPSAMLGANSTSWPADVQKRSYFTDGICGQGTDRACPGPLVPLTRQSSSYHLGPDGQLVRPPGAKPLRLVPFSAKDDAVFNGPVF